MRGPYSAILRGDRLEWLGPTPDAGDGARVDVTIAEPMGMTGRAVLDMLDRLGPGGAFQDVADPVAWQRAERKDRDLPA